MFTCHFENSIAVLRRVEHGNQDASSVGPLVLELNDWREWKKGHGTQV